MSVRLDCNRGSGSWTSAGANQIQFGPLTLTRVMCPQASLHNQIVKQWKAVRSYIIKDEHLFLSLMADGGTYEFEPVYVRGITMLIDLRIDDRSHGRAILPVFAPSGKIFQTLSGKLRYRRDPRVIKTSPPGGRCHIS